MGLGTVVVGGGAALGSGAFTSVEARRDVAVSVADDSQALIGLTAGSSAYVTNTGGAGANLLEIDLSDQALDAAGVNLGGTVTIENAFTVENNHGEGVEITIAGDGSLAGGGVTISFLDGVGGSPIVNAGLDAAGGESNTLDVTLEIETTDAASDFTGEVAIRAEPAP